MPLLSGGMISGNAIVRIEALTIAKDATGKTAETYATLTDDVSALLSNVSASRPEEGGTTRNKLTGKLTGANSGMARVDVRYFVKTTSAYGLTGIYLYPENATVHGASGEGVMSSGAWYSVEFSTVRTT